jgi:hypothetical protein
MILEQNMKQSTWKSRCIISPKLSSLFVLEQHKHSAEAIKDFDKNFELHMHQLIILTTIHSIIPVTDSKVVVNVHLSNVQQLYLLQG